MKSKYDFYLDTLNIVSRLIDFIESYPYIVPDISIAISEDPIWDLDVYISQIYYSYGFLKYAYETRDGYIFVGSWEIDIEDVMLNEYKIDIEEDPEYEEDKWDNPSFLEKMKRKYPEVFREYDEPLKILRELSKERNIVVKELIDKTGIMNFEIGKKISSDRISVLKELLETMRKAYMEALNIDEERMKVKKNENYYRQISKMRELIYQARRIILRRKEENKPVNTILISNASNEFEIEIL